METNLSRCISKNVSYTEQLLFISHFKDLAMMIARACCRVRYYLLSWIKSDTLDLAKDTRRVFSQMQSVMKNDKDG